MTEDAQKDLVERWRQYVKENAARLEAGDERKTSYAQLLRNVDDLIQILRNHEKLVAWIDSVSTVDRDGITRLDLTKLLQQQIAGVENPQLADPVDELCYFDRGGVAHLLSAVWEDFKVGGHAFKDPKLEEEIRTRMERARDGRPSKSDEIKRRAMLAEMHNRGENDLGAIAQRLGISKDATRQLRNRMIDDGSIQERE